MRTFLLVAAVLFCASLARAQPCTVAGAVWPIDAWPSRSESVAKKHSTARLAVEEYAFTLTGADEERRGIRTDGVVVVKGGTIIYERYGRGFAAQHRHLFWSVSKSVVDALTGAAVQRGLLRVEDSICDHLPRFEGDACAIRVIDLLNQASGLRWNEGYEDTSYTASSVLAMLYGEGSTDMAAFVAKHPAVTAPGESFVYTSGGVTLLAAVLGAAVLEPLAADYPWRFLFSPLGMQRVTFEGDNSGTFVGSSLVYATPRAMARFGYLYLRDGCWRNERILPAGWVAGATRINTAFLSAHPFWRGPRLPGRLWWLNRQVDGINTQLPMPDVPADAFAAMGHWGQSVVVIPSLDLVVVRTADDRDDTFDLNTFLRHVIKMAEGV